MYGAAQRMPLNVPVAWLAEMRAKTSGSSSQIGALAVMPALLTRMSTPPKRSAASAIMSSTAPKSVTETGLAIARPPAAAISAATAAAGPASCPAPSVDVPRSFTITAAPSAASCSAVARPMPRPAPVPTAARPSNGRDIAGALTRPLAGAQPGDHRQSKNVTRIARNRTDATEFYPKFHAIPVRFLLDGVARRGRDRLLVVIASARILVVRDVHAALLVRVQEGDEGHVPQVVGRVDPFRIAGHRRCECYLLCNPCRLHALERRHNFLL